MKTLLANNETKYFDSFSFDFLTSEELALVLGGKEDDSYIPPAPRLAALSLILSKDKTENKNNLGLV